VRAGRLPAGAGEAADVGGREDVDEGAEDLVREHGEGAERRLPPAVARRFHRRGPGRVESNRAVGVVGQIGGGNCVSNKAGEAVRRAEEGIALFILQNIPFPVLFTFFQMR
jgi:hypothetical protein